MTKGNHMTNNSETEFHVLLSINKICGTVHTLQTENDMLKVLVSYGIYNSDDL